MTGVAHSSVASLGCSLVEAHLEINLSLAGTQLILSEGSFVLFSHFGAEGGSSELGMLLGLSCLKRNVKSVRYLGEVMWTYDASQGVQTQCHLWNVTSLKQICCLEDLFLGHSVFLDSSLEALHILHQLEVCATLLDLLDRSRCQFVCQTAKHLAVTQNVFVLAGRHFLAEHGKDPGEDFQFLILVTGLKSINRWWEFVNSNVFW